MAEYRLYCFGESGNAYKAALMLELCRLPWKPVFVDFFKGETRTPEYRATINEMGEAPVLEHDGKRLTQSGVILDYLAEVTHKFGPKSDDERREIWRWILFDNHKFTANLATLRFLIQFAKIGRNTGDRIPARALHQCAEGGRCPSGGTALRARQARHHRRSVDGGIPVLRR